MPQITNRFKEWAPEIMRRLIADFGFTAVQAAGVVGNGAHESGGFMQMQELRPTVAGSRGGLGIFQWTGPRRRTFEAWLDRNKDKGWTAHTLDANYSMLFRELTGPERATIAAVKAARTLEEATHAFCKVFERPGIVHMGNRLWWARQALSLFASNPPPEMVRPTPGASMPVPVPVGIDPPWYLSVTKWGAIISTVTPILALFAPQLAGINPDMASQILVATAGPAIGGLMTWLGRNNTATKAKEAIAEAYLAPSPVQQETPSVGSAEAIAPVSLMQFPFDQIMRELPELLDALAKIQSAGRSVAVHDAN